LGDDEGPGCALVPRHLRVHEDVLHLLAPAAESIAGSPCAHLEPWGVRRDRPGPETDGAVLERHAVVLADGANALAKVGFLRALAARKQLTQRTLERARETRALGLGRREREQVLAGTRVELLEQRQDPGPDQTALRRVVRAVLAVPEPGRVTVRARLL